MVKIYIVGNKRTGQLTPVMIDFGKENILRGKYPHASIPKEFQTADLAELCKTISSQGSGMHRGKARSEYHSLILPMKSLFAIYDHLDFHDKYSFFPKYEDPYAHFVDEDEAFTEETHNTSFLIAIFIIVLCILLLELYPWVSHYLN